MPGRVEGLAESGMLRYVRSLVESGMLRNDESSAGVGRVWNAVVRAEFSGVRNAEKCRVACKGWQSLECCGAFRV
jgi:hypothetical protein